MILWLGLICSFLTMSPLLAQAQPGTFVPRQGDEIVVAGQFVHTGARVVLWMDPGGYDAYRVERRFAPLDKADWQHTKAELPDFDSPNRYGLRHIGLTNADLERVRGGGWAGPSPLTGVGSAGERSL